MHTIVSNFILFMIGFGIGKLIGFTYNAIQYHRYGRVIKDRIDKEK
jgi:hypothetical protein